MFRADGQNAAWEVHTNPLPDQPATGTSTPGDQGRVARTGGTIGA